jgi:hypothetical protein
MNATPIISRFSVTATVLALGLLAAPAALAQDANDSGDGWSSAFTFYLLGPTLDGTVGIGPLDATVDMSAGDVFSALDMAFLGFYAGEGERWGVVADLVYMDLSEDDISGPLDLVSGELGNRQASVLLSASYRVSDSTRLLAGMAYTDISADIRIDTPANSRYAKTSESWADPMVGVLYNTPMGKNWDFSGLAQVGGGVGSDLTYVLTASFAWQFGDRSSLTLGYRYLYFDYEKGNGANRFKFDMKQHGPAVGYRFRW